MGNSKNGKVDTSQYGKIFIYTQKKAVTAGELEQGTINLNLIKNFPGDTLVIQLIGKEKVHWQEDIGSNESREVKYYNDKKRFFQNQFIVYKFPDGMAPIGQYNFPFSFQTHPNLPSNFAIGINAFVYYKLKVILMNFSDTTQTMHFQQRMVIQNNLKRFPQIQEKSDENKVMTCCCSEHGRGALKCKLEKNAFYSNEMIRVDVFVDNKSKIDFSYLRAVLLRTIRLTAYNRENVGSHSSYQSTLVNSPERIPNQQSKQILIQLAARKTPSYVGKLIQVAYEIDVQAIPDGCLCLRDKTAHCGSFPQVLFPVIIEKEHIPENNYVMPAMYNQYMQQSNWNPQTFSPVQFQFNHAQFQGFQDTSFAQMQQEIQPAKAFMQPQNQLGQLQIMQAPMQGHQYSLVFQNNQNQNLQSFTGQQQFDGQQQFSEQQQFDNQNVQSNNQINIEMIQYKK